MRHIEKAALSIAIGLSLTACGGGGGSTSNVKPVGSNPELVEPSKPSNSTPATCDSSCVHTITASVSQIAESGAISTLAAALAGVNYSDTDINNAASLRNTLIELKNQWHQFEAKFSSMPAEFRLEYIASGQYAAANAAAAFLFGSNNPSSNALTIINLIAEDKAINKQHADLFIESSNKTVEIITHKKPSDSDKELAVDIASQLGVTIEFTDTGYTITYPVVEEPTDPVVEEPTDPVVEELRETVTVQLDRYISGQVETSRYTSVNKVTTTEFADDNGDIIVVETTTYRTQINYSDIVTTVYETTTTIEYNDGSTETHTTQYSEDQLVPADPVVTYHSVETDRYYKETETPIEVPTSPEIVEYASVEYSDPNLGTPTPDVKTPAEYRASSEFWATAAATDDHLAEIKVDAAWSRGWTGKGSVVAVADSGAMVTHSDLDAQITATKNFITGLTDVTDNVGHGTHVAGTIAAEMNNQGMVGVAPDAKLMIAKVTDNTGYSFSLAKQATKWASDAGAVAINMSASSMFDNSFKLSLTKHSTGMFSSNHWYYGTNGYNGYVSEAGTWKPYIGNEIVMVVAAGNDGLDYAAFPGLMATAVDDNGNLILDGRMIIAGAWDTANQKIANYSNKAGHVCLAWNEGTQSCDDLYKIKDFYLMAPGSTVYSTMPNGSYNHMSGTSMAAPHITGAVAIIHQMWPHMTGRNLVQLLLVTGDKSFAGYDENIHGQGLLDMDRATQPVGATGIPKTGRTSGGVTELSGGIAGSVELGEVASNVMVLDSFERDFYVDLGQAKIDKDTRTVSFTESLANDTITNSFASLAGAVYQVNDMIFALGEKSFAVGKQYGNFEIGYVSEDETVLNNEFAGMFGVGQTSETVYAAYTRSDILAGFNVDTKAEIGYTTSSTTDNSLITSTSGITSVALHGAVTRPLGDYWVAGATASMPRKILDGSMGLTVPVARTLDGRVLFEDRTMDLSKGNTEFDVGVVAKYRKNNSKFSAYLEHRFNQYGSDTNGTEVRVNYELNF